MTDDLLTIATEAGREARMLLGRRPVTRDALAFAEEAANRAVVRSAKLRDMNAPPFGVTITGVPVADDAGPLEKMAAKENGGTGSLLFSVAPWAWQASDDEIARLAAAVRVLGLL